MEFLNNIELLSKISSYVQVVAIILVFLGGGLQFTKFELDKRIHRLTEQFEVKKDQEHTLQLSELQGRIATLKDKIPDRNITVQDQGAIIPILQKASSSKVTFFVTSNERESIAFTNQLIDLFKKSGWVVNGPLVSIVSGTFRGVGIEIKDANNRPKSLNPVEEVLFKILKLKVQGGIDQTLNQDEIKIIIGAQ